MRDIHIFKNPEFGQIRTVAFNGEPWLVGKDVAEALGYSNTKDALARHVDPEDKTTGDGVVIRDPMGREQHPIIINESGLYSLVLGSKLPGAKKFKRWVTGEVLPAIRKTGVYASPTVTSDMMFQLARTMREKEQRIGQLEAENEEQKQALADVRPKVEYLDTILNSPGALATSQIAADYGISAKKLNAVLHEAGLQHNVNGQWILYQKHMGKGLTRSKTIHFNHSDGRPDTRVTTQWTQKGRLRIHQILTDIGYRANMDREAER